jgi:hypothetical protein
MNVNKEKNSFVKVQLWRKVVIEKIPFFASNNFIIAPKMLV